jgi:hypothetical protein
MARNIFPVQSFEWDPEERVMRPRYLETHYREGEVVPGSESVVARGLTEGMGAAGLDPEQAKAVKQFEDYGKKQFADMLRRQRAAREEEGTTFADKRQKRQERREERGTAPEDEDEAEAAP